jgi:hypothetical protein
MTSTRFRVFFVAAAAIGLLILSLRFFGRDGSREVPDVVLPNHAETQTAPSAEPPPVTPEKDVIGPEDLTLLAGQTLEISADALPAGRAVALNLQLAEPSANNDPLAGRILSEGRVPLGLSAAILGEDRRTARVEIEAGWLSAGRYVIEVQTTERTHFPLRRYALEVR